MRDKNEESKTVLKENIAMSENSISSEIVNQFMKEHAPDLQAFNAALNNLAEFQKKEKDCLNEIDLLRAKCELPAQEMGADDVTKMIKTRRIIQEEIRENEEILKTIQNHFLPKAKKETEVQYARVFGILSSIVNPFNTERQIEINQHFDQIKMLVKDFEDQIASTIISLVGNHSYSFVSPQSRLLLSAFSFKNAPTDPFVPFFLRGMV